ncbi:uncharacterized protein PADG_12289 [Paracoccidioides brasiliensis Pb18]|uniref:Uncharacterized protein n=1 Tax=Paracoccidioides brasiliensis (strain Pb18) TaxID=502780 RepID=A0A0A0HTG5_PARBD|nr:uncharacterized protein PADG_12289 [Paracoccidioides brasiliensis Pb18]KGM91608.1 hypothetical protein PADG_12289 [Paracoccidioides brasiliensis Pb18]
MEQSATTSKTLPTPGTRLYEMVAGTILWKVEPTSIIITTSPPPPTEPRRFAHFLSRTTYQFQDVFGNLLRLLLG